MAAVGEGTGRSSAAKAAAVISESRNSVGPGSPSVATGTQRSLKEERVQPPLSFLAAAASGAALASASASQQPSQLQVSIIVIVIYHKKVDSI